MKLLAVVTPPSIYQIALDIAASRGKIKGVSPLENSVEIPVVGPPENPVELPYIKTLYLPYCQVTMKATMSLLVKMRIQTGPHNSA